MGPRNAGIKADATLRTETGAAITSKPDAVLIVGLCGGLTASLPEGRIVAYTECRSIEARKPLYECSKRLADSIPELLQSSNILCERVVGITSSWVATTPERRASLAKLGADVVDMESYSVLEPAAAAGIPAAVLRVVSDSADRELPDFNRALDNKGGIDWRKALRVALGSPLRTAKLFAANRRAMQHLAKALEIVLKSPCFA
jgi:nucleoside phosphorylase